MDALSDALRTCQLTGGVFWHASFYEPWCLADELDPDECASYVGAASHLILYHYVVEGSLKVRVAGAPDLELGPGEVVMFPRNDSHLLGGQLDLTPVRSCDVVPEAKYDRFMVTRLGGDGALTRVVCGVLGFECADGNPIVATLPSILRLNVDETGSGDWMRTTFHYAADEVLAGRPGSATVLVKLSELLFAQAIRHYVGTLPSGATGWLAGLRDPFVSKALAALHSAVSRDWTVEALAREAGLSRSALSDRFTRLLGQAPMHYLAHWRMQLAAQSMRDTDGSLAQIAVQVGYDSEAAFSRAFKRIFGVAPATWRRGQARAA